MNWTAFTAGAWFGVGVIMCLSQRPPYFSIGLALVATAFAIVQRLRS